MTLRDPSPPDSPKPPGPIPNCTQNCGPIPLNGVHWRDWTCRCGYGYFTPEKQWISGFDVRHGRQPPKEQKTDIQHGSSLSCRDHEAQRELPVSSPPDVVFENIHHGSTGDCRPQEVSSHILDAASRPPTPSRNSPQHNVHTPAVAGTSNYASPNSSGAAALYAPDTSRPGMKRKGQNH